MAHRQIIVVFSENHTRHQNRYVDRIGEFLNIVTVATYSNHYALMGQSQHTVGGTTLESGKIAQYECITHLSVLDQIRPCQDFGG
jgi:hypothetical protein